MGDDQLHEVLSFSVIIKGKIEGCYVIVTSKKGLSRSYERKFIE